MTITSGSQSPGVPRQDLPLAARPAENESDLEKNRRTFQGLIEDHILPRLDNDFLEYYAEIQARLGTQQQAVSNLSIEHVRAHPEAYRSPCALDTSGHPGVADFSYPSQDGVNIHARVYHPDPVTYGRGPYPVHLNFHGQLLHCHN